MTGTLQRLFDFQHFAENKKLQSIIDDTMARYSTESRAELHEDDLNMLFAAGSTDYAAPKDPTII